MEDTIIRIWFYFGIVIAIGLSFLAAATAIYYISIGIVILLQRKFVFWWRVLEFMYHREDFGEFMKDKKRFPKLINKGN